MARIVTEFTHYNTGAPCGESMTLVSEKTAFAKRYPRGTELGTTRWYTLSDARMQQFCQVLLVSDSGPVTQMLHLSMLPMLLAELKLPTGWLIGINYGFDRIRFLRMPAPDEPVRARFVVASISERMGKFWVRTNVTFEAQGNADLLMTAEWLAVIGID